MNEELAYLEAALGMRSTVSTWDKTDGLPLFLRHGVEIAQVSTDGIDFLLARQEGDASLPSLKRLYSQLSDRTDIPVVVSAPWASARQRQALVSQHIPFVCAGKQAFLPFLGLASTEWGKAKLELPLGRKLAPKAQQAAIWGALNEGPYTPSELRSATGMAPSQASAAVSELVRRGLAQSTRIGRSVTIHPLRSERLLSEHMVVLSSPVLKTVTVERTRQIEDLPDAGETALSHRTMLNRPAVLCKAIDRPSQELLRGIERIRGELPDSEIATVQVWRYAPVFNGSHDIDPISLALSLADVQDERVEGEICSLFGKDYPWQEAQ